MMMMMVEGRSQELPVSQEALGNDSLWCLTNGFGEVCHGIYW